MRDLKKLETGGLIVIGNVNALSDRIPNLVGKRVRYIKSLLFYISSAKNNTPEFTEPMKTDALSFPALLPDRRS